MPQPGRSAAAGQHWVYRFDGQRKCWFQAAEETALARKPARHRLERRSVAASEEDKPAPRKQESPEDARAEMLSSPPAEAPQPTPPEPPLKMVRTVRVTDAAAMVPPMTALDRLASDQPTPDQPTPRRVDVERLLEDSPAASDEVASTPSATLIAGPGATMEVWVTPRFGVLLMMLGGVSLLSASRKLRRVLWPVRSRDTGTELLDIVYDGRNDLSFGRIAAHRPVEIGEVDRRGRKLRV